MCVFMKRKPVQTVPDDIIVSNNLCLWCVGGASDHEVLHYKKKETHSVIQTQAAAVKESEADTTETYCTTSDTFQPEGKNNHWTKHVEL